MKYRCNENISLPFRVIPVINELGRTRLEVKVAVKSSFNDKLFALNVVITIPMPDNTARADIQPSQGMEQTRRGTEVGRKGLCNPRRPHLGRWNMLSLLDRHNCG